MYIIHIVHVNISTAARSVAPLTNQVDCCNVCSETGWRSKFTRRASWSELQQCLGHSVWWWIYAYSSSRCVPFSRLHVRLMSPFWAFSRVSFCHRCKHCKQCL